MSESEKNLWEAFQNGSRDAFEEILRTYYRSLFDYGLKFQKDHDLLKDQVHDLFVNIWDRRAFLAPNDNLKLYLFKALRNQIFRTKSRGVVLTELTEEYEEVQREEGDAETVIIGSEVVDERILRIRLIMQKLSPRQQEVLHLRFFENLSNLQISQVLDITEASVYNLVSLSLKQFKKYWNMYYWLLLLVSLTASLLAC